GRREGQEEAESQTEDQKPEASIGKVHAGTAALGCPVERSSAAWRDWRAMLARTGEGARAHVIRSSTMPQTIVEKIAQSHLAEGPNRPLRTGDFVSIRPF